MKPVNILLLLIFIITFFSVSCKRNPYKVRTRPIEDIEIRRLEKDLFSLNPEDIISRLPVLKSEYGSILQLFSYSINTGEINDPEFGDYLVRFCTDKQNNDIYDLTMQIYPDLSELESELTNAFRHYSHYFPGKPVPEIFTCITGFNASIITMSGEPLLGIGLDKYLGADCTYYPALGIYKYISDRMTPDYIIPDCIYGWGASLWEFESIGYPADNVLAEVIHAGKLRYFTRCMLPYLPDEIIFGFSPGQMKFTRNNEGQMWQYLIENDLIFKTDPLVIRKLVGEAPFTSYFTNESPGRAAVWIGFRIVESYMKRTGSMNIDALMKNTDVQDILEKARYSPQ